MRPGEILCRTALLGAEARDSIEAKQGRKNTPAPAHFPPLLAFFICFNFSAYSG